MKKKNRGIDFIFSLSYLFLFLFAFGIILTAAVNVNGQNFRDCFQNDKQNCKAGKIISDLKSIDQQRLPADPVCFEKKESLICSENSIEEDYQNEAAFIAKTVWGEARGCSSIEQEAVIWCILNRVDSDSFPNDIVSVIVQPYQFAGYSQSNPVDQDMYDMALDVIVRWQAEKNGAENVGRVLPADYLYFHGDGVHNYFRRDFSKYEDFWNFAI